MENESSLTLLLQAAVSMHEMFITLMESGFTEMQALYLVGQILRPNSSP